MKHRQKRTQLIQRLILLAGLIALACAGALLSGLRETAPAAPPPAVSAVPQPSAPPAPSEPPASVPAPAYPAPLPEERWALFLVNPQHPLPDGYAPPSLTEVRGGYQVDSRIADALEAMLSACEAAGLSPMICSAYRTQERQQALFAAQVDKQRAAGAADAQTAAAAVVAVPGTSEHQTGLAVDLCAKSYQLLDDAQAQTPEYQWLAAHCAAFGFIVRYPETHSDRTGIIHEPWHFRYVGRTAARTIMEEGLCLEDYLDHL